MTPTDPRPTDAFERRRFLALGAGAGLTVLAGCSSGPTDGSGGADGGSGSGPSAGSTGGFRLLVSDQPSAIGDFDSLVVTLEDARVFRADGDDDGEEDEGDDGTETTTEETTEETTTEETTEETTTEATTTTTEEATSEEAEGDGDDDGDQGFAVLDLGGKTVDLTTVVGEKATGVFDGELAEGRYTKVELNVTEVEGIVDEAAVDVKLPSEKLQITKNFEVVAGETLSFVFDITVVERGQGGYNLLPVISESGVAGRDVEVQEVGPAAQAGGDDDPTGGGSSGPPEPSPGEGTPGGNGGTDASDGG